MSAAHEFEHLSISAWAHAAGILDLGSPSEPRERSEASDREAFCERIARYCWAYDERWIERLADCFTDDAIWEGSVLGEVAIGPFAGRDTIVDWLSKFWPHQHDQRRHMILNTIVDYQTENAAGTSSYLLLMASTGAVASIESTGFYRTAYRRDGAAWRISHLTAGFDKPFWPGELKTMSAKGRIRHGVRDEA